MLHGVPIRFSKSDPQKHSLLFLRWLPLALTCCVLAVSAVAQQNPSKTRVEVETLTLKAHGFVPKQLVRKPGPFVLAINNRSGQKEIAISLSSNRGAGVRALRISQERPSWRDLLDLPPGDYVIRELSHPAWSCALSIRAR